MKIYLNLKHMVVLFYAPVFLMIFQAQAEVRELKYGSFSFEQAVKLPGKPEVIYDAISGDNLT